MNHIDTMKQALEALEHVIYWDNEKPEWEYAHAAITALREALAEQRKPLTDEEIEQCMKQAYATVQGRNLEHAFARAIEATHGIKE